MAELAPFFFGVFVCFLSFFGGLGTLGVWPWAGSCYRSWLAAGLQQAIGAGAVLGLAAMKR